MSMSPPKAVWPAVHWEDNEPGADRAPGRFRAGEGVAWRHYLTGRLVSWAYFAGLFCATWTALSYLPSTSFQKSAAGFWLISVSPGIDRKIFSYSGR